MEAGPGRAHEAEQAGWGLCRAFALHPPGLAPLPEVLCKVLVSSSCVPVTLAIITSVPVSRCHFSDCTQRTDPKLKCVEGRVDMGWSVPGTGLLTRGPSASLLNDKDGAGASPGRLLQLWDLVPKQGLRTFLVSQRWGGQQVLLVCGR